MLNFLILLLCLPRALSVQSCDFNLAGEYVSSDFPEYHAAFSRLRADTGTINGPLPVQPNAPDPQYDYNVSGYIQSFKKIGLSWVRFQDLGMTQGGTSLSQIFTAWPLTDADLEAADVDRLVSNSDNFNFTSLDMHVKAATALQVHIDFRLGDSHQIAALLQGGKPVPVGDKTIQFPKAWGFPTNIESAKGMSLWSGVAMQVAERVWHLVGADSNKVSFDLLTETTDGNCFWPSSAARYAKLYSLVMSQIKARFGVGVQCIGGNTMSPMKPGADGGDPWLVTFLEECGKMGYQACPLDIVAFHIFSPEAAKLIPKNARWVIDQMNQYLKGYETLPRLAMTAWGFHGSGMYDYNAQPSGAAVMANGLIAIENTPLEFTIYYKWSGINCKNPKSPCLVVNVPGSLKPVAIPFEFHSRMRKLGTGRIQADCNNLRVVAIRGEDNRTLAAMVAPISSASTTVAANSPASLKLKIASMPCATQKVTLSIDYVASTLAPDGSAITKTMKVNGKLSQSNFFVADGAKEPYEVQAAMLSYATLFVLTCESDPTSTIALV